MAHARRVFNDLTNTTDDVLTFRYPLKVGDASKLGAPRDPAYTTDFNILADTPGGEKLGHPCDVEVRPAQPDQSTSQDDLKLPLKGSHEALGRGLGKKGDDGLPELVALCASDLRDLWDASVRSGGHRIMALLHKYGSMGPPRLAAAFFSPPPGAPPPPYAESWPHRKSATQGESCAGEAADPKPLPTVDTTLATRALVDTDIEHRSDGAMRGLVHDVLRSHHLLSERRLANADAILKNFPAEERERTLMWLFQVCSSVNFQDSVLHMAVLLLDRYCSELSAPIPLERLQLVTIAMLSLSLKMNGAIDENSKPPKLQNLLVHLSMQRYTIQEIFEAEHEVLRFLGYGVSMPTAVELLDTFLMPHGCPGESGLSSPVICIAQFLLQLSLLDAPLHYRYSHAVLAAGAVYVALWCAQRAPEHVLALLEDVAACFDNDT